MIPVPHHRLLTISEYMELGETAIGYTELLEGRLLLSPSPPPHHNIAAMELACQLQPQLPEHLEVVQRVDIDLELVPPDQPGYSRRPDLVIYQRSARERVRSEGDVLRASEVLVVVEIASGGSKYSSYHDKCGHYLEAKIPHYWVLDLTGAEPTLVNVFSTTTPFPITLRLDQLI